MSSKKTIVLGASPNPDRASYQAVQLLNSKHHDVIALGIKAGIIDGIEIQLDKPMPTAIDTISLYLGPDKQAEWYPYILSIHPRRIIFNPGTENQELLQLAQAHGIQTEAACTLVLLSTGQY
ncbi:MAG: CoA-binding protein [Saprospiraceae bacterium]|nr:CoA-binding protein [Saprospiraceae bacterium]HRG69900.1 CoA-binding protein [Saprospiraceae bacterium]